VFPVCALVMAIVARQTKKSEQHLRCSLFSVRVAIRLLRIVEI
jgi:hypothetical protein